MYFLLSFIHVYTASISRNCLSLLKQIREVEIPTNFSIMKALYFNILFKLKYFLFAKDYGKIIMPPYFFAMVNWCVLIDIRLFWSRTNLSFTFYFWRIMGITLSNLHIKIEYYYKYSYAKRTRDSWYSAKNRWVLCIV